MKKKFILLAAILTIALVILTGCGNKNNVSMIDSMKKAAKDAGYAINDDYIGKSNENIAAGFTVLYPSEDGDINVPIYEFKDEDAANAYAKWLNDDGYQLAIVNGKYLTMVSVDDKGAVQNENEKAFLEDLINGRKL